VLVPVGDVAEPLLDLLVKKAKAVEVGDGMKSGVEMGPLVTGDHRNKVVGYIEKGFAEGAKPLCDGREAAKGKDGFFVGPTIFDNVTPQMTIAKEEIFGPVLSVIRVKSLEDAIDLVNSSKFGNTTSIFTGDEKRARLRIEDRVRNGRREYRVAAPMAFFPFSGWKQSFFGDLHAHGRMRSGSIRSRRS